MLTWPNILRRSQRRRHKLRRAGHEKALLILCHLVSEQAGMKYCAEWLRGFVPEVPVEFIAADEPFWRPGKPAK